MPFSYKIDKERRLMKSTASGVITMADALAHQEELLKDPEFDLSFGQLIDVTQVTGVEIGSSDLRALSQTRVHSPTSHRAILASGDLVFGLARMFAIFRETMGETGICVFRNLEDALEWVLAKDDV
jgi:hypothetical protein